MVNGIDNWAQGYLRSMLSESDGTASSSRFCIVAVILFTLGFVSALLWKIHGPISAAEFSQAVGSLTLFATGLCGALYGINRAADVLNNRAGGPQQ
jgi:uncharacterized membrane protein